MITFPEKEMAESEAREHLEKIRSGMEAYPETAFRVYSTNPHPLAIEAITKFLPYNKNNIGTHTRVENPKGLAALEKEVILMLGNLFGASESDVDGYITQGGTEGNIMGLWIGRNMLRAIDDPGSSIKHQLCLLKTSLTHYSIDKAADILDIKKVVDISLNEEYGMSSASLENKIKELVGEGYKNFLIALTLGYNTTGTIDPVDEIDEAIRRLKRELNINTYVHLDAAIGGVIYPFVAEKPLDFRYQSIQSISLDMHKTGLLPHTAGVFLCRKDLQKWIERQVPYLPRGKDDTLSGSRPAAAAAACWNVLNALGKDGFVRLIKQEWELKKYFLDLIKEKNIPLDIIHHPLIPIVAFSLKEKMLPLAIEKKYTLLPTPLTLGNEKQKSFYTIIFMPHITKTALEKFANDLNALFNAET